MSQTYRITLLPGDGIGPEIMAVTVDILQLLGEQDGIAFEFTEALLGGAAIDATGLPLPEETLARGIRGAPGSCLTWNMATCINRSTSRPTGMHRAT